MADVGTDTQTQDNTDSNNSNSGGITATLNSPDFWRNLMMFGANVGVAANARTPGGFLQYGAGPMGAIGAGVLGAAQDARQYQQFQNQRALNQAQIGNMQSEAQLRKAQVGLTGAQTQEALINQRLALQKANIIQQQLANPDNNGIGGSSSANATNAPTTPNGPLSLSQAINQIEDPTYQKVTQPNGKYVGGYAGGYQFGTQALADDGLYQPAQGEDLSQNQWKGQITLPGQNPVNLQQFLGNKALQDQAFAIHSAKLGQQADVEGLTDNIGKVVNGVPITPDTITAMAHFGGVTGAKRFLYTNGQYDPADINGTTLSGYAGKVASLMGLTGRDLPPVPGAAASANNRPNIPATPVSAVTPQSAVATSETPSIPGQRNPVASGNPAPVMLPNTSIVSGTTGPAPASGGNIPMLPNGMSASQALANADALDRQADLWKSIGIDSTGKRNQATALRDMATAYSKAEAEAQARFGYQPAIRLDAGGVAYQNGKIVAAVPRVTQELLPDGSTATIMRNPVTNEIVGDPIPEKMSPLQEETQRKVGEELGETYGRIDKMADVALDSNNQLNQLLQATARNKDSFLAPGGGTTALASVGGALSGLMNKFGISTDQWNASLGNIQQMQSLMGAAARSAIHEAGGRSNTELAVITNSLPNPDMTPDGIALAAAPLMGANDFDIAKQQAKQAWWNKNNRSLDGFEADFNSKITPGAFTLNRLQQSEYGQSAIKAMIANMQKTKQGQTQLKNLMNEYKYGQENGYFDNVDTTGTQSIGNMRQASVSSSTKPAILDNPQIYPNQ